MLVPVADYAASTAYASLTQSATAAATVLVAVGSHLVSVCRCCPLNFSNTGGVVMRLTGAYTLAQQHSPDSAAQQTDASDLSAAMLSQR